MSAAFCDDSDDVRVTPRWRSSGPARRRPKHGTTGRILIKRHYRSAVGLRGRYRRHTIQRREGTAPSQGRAGMDAQAFLSQPGVGFFSMLVIGALAGWIAGKVTESRHGILTSILVGIAGAFVGGELAGLLNIEVFGFFRTLVSATVGAIVILWVWRRIRSTA
jgi:uncharacterized membrane protein YeaQ/YmgE (transglycosylase-associated protein family)